MTFTVDHSTAGIVILLVLCDFAIPFLTLLKESNRLTLKKAVTREGWRLSSFLGHEIPFAHPRSVPAPSAESQPAPWSERRRVT
ncbi:MAG TPA: hypothetical protein VGK73_15120, partial [Polyangiaceae bacterium]